MKRSIRGRWWELWAGNSLALICDLELRCSKSNKCSMSVTSISATAPKTLEGQCREASFSARKVGYMMTCCTLLSPIVTQLKVFALSVELLDTYGKSYCPHVSLPVDHTETLMFRWSMRWSKQFKGSFVWSALESPWSLARRIFFYLLPGIRASWTSSCVPNNILLLV